jgi:hypothetical protein
MWSAVKTVVLSAIGLLSGLFGYISRRSAKKAVEVVAENANARTKIDAESQRRSGDDTRERMRKWTRGH